VRCPEEEERYWRLRVKLLNDNYIIISSFDFNKLKSRHMKVTVYNQEGKEVGTTLLPKDIFDVKINSDLLWQVAVSQTASRRNAIAHTKTRGEVRGGGKRPWRQKGTGRARHASIRSPLWRHGGITFGPTKKRVFQKKINKKMQKSALFMALSAKAGKNLILILDNLSLERAKTKLMFDILKKLPIKGSAMIILPELRKDIFKAAGNIPKVEVVEARNLNALDLLSFKYLVMLKESIKVIKDTFLGRGDEVATSSSLHLR